MNLVFRFNLDKAIEVTAILRKLHGSNISNKELLQMLYLIDRCSIRDTNYPIIGGVYIKHLTVMIEEVYQCLLCHPNSPKIVQERHFKWKNYFSFDDDFYLDLVNDPGSQNLSMREEKQIRFICKIVRYLNLGTSVFNFPEWESERNYSTLDIEKLLKVLGKTDEEVEEIKMIAERENYLDILISR
jgi:hypothetical protein